MGGGRESFALPREEPAQDAIPARETRSQRADDAAQTRREAGETRQDVRQAQQDSRQAQQDARQAQQDVRETRRGDDRSSAAPQASSASAEKEDARDAAAATAKASAPQPGKTVDQGGEAAPAAPSQAPILDIAALVSIASAAQAEGAPVKGNSSGEAQGKQGQGDPGEGDLASLGAATEPKAEAIDITPALAAPPSGPVLLAPVPTLPITLAADPSSADDAGEGNQASGTAAAASFAAASAAASAIAPAPTGETLTTAGAGKKVSAAPVGEGAPGFSAGLQGAALGSVVPSPDGEPAASPPAGQAGSDPVVAPPGPPTGQGAPSAEFKPGEAFQPAANFIDLSALNQQGARPEPLRFLTMPEPMAAQSPAAAHGQATGESAPTPLHVLPIEIGLRALAGARQFDIRLDPGELGRVDVNLSISDTGEVTAKMVVDRVETLHLLQRDARTLERAFEQAGLKPSEAGVDISLRDPADQSGFRQNRQQDEAQQRARARGDGSPASEDLPVSAPSTPMARSLRLGGVDLSI